ncbi:hypothetical protein BDN70DRAFT_827540 [Pholiota conissans]|uniref:Uncharacterized protein n=1 Tax=Pholiota conissans TaxID=109636 RepID=A0A9P6D4H9_9AGAR|nr:hypothetical protein BDN70DRAFT_827540 [Pholiota conissans]
MGKSAKLHKRVPKKLKSSSSIAANTSNVTATSSRTQIESAKKRSTLKQKSGSGFTKSGNGPILGGADYVSLLMGSRRKVREEAKKLPQDDTIS